MSRSRSQFVCQQCEYAQSQWAGKCPNCDTWNSMVESVTKNPSSKAPFGSAQGRQFPNKTQVLKLKDIKVDENARVKTGSGELDNVLGGGLVPGMVVLVAGEPGIGKSTLLTQVALKTKNVLYVCGEESATQVALRIKRLEPSVQRLGELFFLESTDVDEVVAKIDETRPGFVIFDSIQMMRSGDLTGVAGSV